MPDPQQTTERLDEAVQFLKDGDGNFDYLTDADKETMRKALNRLRTIAKV